MAEDRRNCGELIMRRIGDVNCVLKLDFESLRGQIKVLEECLEFDSDNAPLQNVINILQAIQCQAINKLNKFTEEEVYGKR